MFLPFREKLTRRTNHRLLLDEFQTSPDCPLMDVHLLGNVPDRLGRLQFHGLSELLEKLRSGLDVARTRVCLPLDGAGLDDTIDSGDRHV